MPYSITKVLLFFQFYATGVFFTSVFDQWYCLPLMLLSDGTSILHKIWENGTQIVSSSSGHLNDLAGPFGDINFTNISLSSLLISNIIPTHHSLSYNHVTYDKTSIWGSAGNLSKACLMSNASSSLHRLAAMSINYWDELMERSSSR